MPKQRRYEDRAKVIVIPSNIACQPQPTQSKAKAMGVKSRNKGPKLTQGKGKGKLLEIPIHDICPELKQLLIAEMIKGLRAKIVTKKGSKKPKKD